jgi:hypothetical protein
VPLGGLKSLTNREGFSKMLDTYPALSKRRASLLDRLWPILSQLCQAHSAVHLYEELSRQCDAALAQQGLRRTDVLRICL